MILKRMRGEPGGLGSALASVTAAGAQKTSFSKAAYDSVKERIAANMSSAKSTSMPLSSSSPSTTSATLPLPASPSPKLTTAATLALSAKKRKRGDEASDVSSPAEASDYGEGIRKRTPLPTASSTPTTTKSGRQILKPDTYDPAAEDNIKKRSQLGKRTTEQALCKKCTRMHSPATNQMVFCDGCNDPWHQRCHEPWIEDEVVRDPDVKWYCAVCSAKRERLTLKKKPVVEPPQFGSWAGKPAGQVSLREKSHGRHMSLIFTIKKRAYLSGLPQAELVNLLVHATELHPDLPVFPIGPTSTKATATMPRSLFAGTSTEGLFTRAEANPTGQMNFIRKIPANAKKSTMAKARSGPGTLQSKAAAQAQSIRSSSGHQLLTEEEDSSFTKLWPRPGKGMYSRLPPEADDDRQLVDGSDYDAFSVIVFNEKGKKIEENGVKA